jgi:DNA-binding MarR family transcriptional regulator
MNKKEESKKIEYLISLFFNTGRLIKEKSCDNFNGMPIHKHHFSMLRIEVVQLIKDEEPTMKRIAEYLHVKAPSATSLINGLVKVGYIKRIQDQHDRRIIKMRITETGEQFLEDGLRQMTEKLKVVLLKLKKEQIDSFIQIMLDINNIYK